MASRKENLKSLFTNTRSRVIIIFTAIILMVAVVVGIYKFSSITRQNVEATSSISEAPAGIQSVPGALNPTAQYASLQEAQNVQQAQQALQTGSSAIPTIIRTQALGQGVQLIGPPPGQSGVGFQALAREETGPSLKSLWTQTLKSSDCSNASMQQILSQGGSLNDLKTGCTCTQLKNNGYNLNNLNQVCSCTELREAGYGAGQLKAAGFSAGRLRLCGFDACDLHSAGFSALAMKNGGFTDGELKGAGYPESEILKASGIPPGVTVEAVRLAGCQADALTKLRDAGVTAAAIRRISGCSAAQLKAAGYTAQALRYAGFSAADLKNAGFTAAQLRSGGFLPRELLNAGFTPADLRNAGFTPGQIRAGEVELPPGITPNNVEEAGCSEGALSRERLAGVSAVLIRQYAGCTAKELKRGGFTDQDLSNAGFTPAGIEAASPMGDAVVKAAGCDPAKLHGLFEAGISAAQIRALNGCTAAVLKAAGYNAVDLVRAGFTPDQLSAAGFTPEEINPPTLSDAAIKASGCDVGKLHVLYEEGVSASRIRSINDCSASALRAAGFSARDLLSAGFTPKQLLAAGFSPKEVNAAVQAENAKINAAGCDANALAQLRAEGVSAYTIHRLNDCSVGALKAAGFDANALLNAGFTPDQLKAAGFSASQIQSGEKASEAEIKAAACDTEKVAKLRMQGITAAKIHALNGCSASQLSAAGYDASDLLDAGFTPNQLASAGFTPQDIRAAESTSDYAIKKAGCNPEKLQALRALGITASKIRNLNGCSVEALKQAGYTAKELANAGFSPLQLLAAGFTPQQLSAAGLSPSAIIAAGRGGDCSTASLTAAREMGVSALTIKDTLGCGASALKSAGYTAAELNQAGFTAAELKNAGFTAAELKNAGFTAKELRDAGFTATQLKAAGFTASELKEAGFSANELKAAGFDATQLREAGYTAKQLKEAGYTAAELKAAGFTAKELKEAGYNAKQLRDAGFTASELHDAGFSSAQLANAGFSNQDLQNAGFSAQESSMAGVQPLQPMTLPGVSAPSSTLPSIDGRPSAVAQMQANEAMSEKRLQAIMKRQQLEAARQRYQQKIQQRTNSMISTANQALQSWKSVSGQIYVGSVVSDKQQNVVTTEGGVLQKVTATTAAGSGVGMTSAPVIKTGEVLFAVLDTAVNSDEPGPILATIVSGHYSGAKLIGSFNLPSNADKMVITFNTMTVPGAPRSIPISAVAIDPDTARTALSSSANHHYLLRYGSLFASTFLEGFGNAFQSANTTITIGGTGGMTNTTVSNGVGRSVLENAVIGLATLGKSWGQVAQQQFNRPTTVQVCAGTSLGILFTQDVRGA